MKKKTLTAVVMLFSAGVLTTLFYKQWNSRLAEKPIAATTEVSPAPVSPETEAAPALEAPPQKGTSLPEPKLPSGISPAWSRSVSGRDNPDGIGFGVAGMSYFSRLERLPNEQAIKAIQKVARVDESTAAAYMKYVKESQKAFKEFFPTIVPQECQNQSKLQTIPQIADAMKRMADKAQTRRVEIIRGSERVLGAEGMWQIENHINTEVKKSLSTVRVNELEMLYSMNETPEAIVAKLCAPQPGSQ